MPISGGPTAYQGVWTPWLSIEEERSSVVTSATTPKSDRYTKLHTAKLTPEPSPEIAMVTWDTLSPTLVNRYSLRVDMLRKAFQEECFRNYFLKNVSN